MFKKFLKLHLHHFLKIKSQKEVTKHWDPDPYLILIEPDPDPGGPKTCGSYGSGSGSATLVATKFSLP